MRLHTFGGLSLEIASSGGDLPALAPRHLALLSIVAAAEPRSVTRDRIVGILWAETGEEQARHTLSQNLYFLRRETGKDLISGTTQLRLDSSITSDIAEFRLALDGGDLTSAAAIYAGPFLQGFHLPGAPEFERWVEDERARLQSAAITAIETLADRAAAAGSINESIGWWRRLRELDSFSARYAGGLIRALISAGDRAAALRFAQGYEAELARELDAEVDPSIRELISSLHVKAAMIQDAASRVSTRGQTPPEWRSLTPSWVWGLLVVGIATALLGWSLTRSARSGDTMLTTSAPAHALYEEGLRAIHMSDAVAAYRLMTAALERDSTFAMAAYYSSLAARGMGREPEADSALEIAERLATDANERERLLILTEVAGRKAPISEYLRSAKELTRRYPGDAEGQMLLGSSQFTAGDWLASVEAYDRSAEIDSVAGVIRGPFCRVCTALIAMSHSYLWADSAAAAERTGRRLIARFPHEGLAWGSLIEPLLRQNRWSDAEAAIAKAAGMSLTRSDFSASVDRGMIRSGRFSELDLKIRSNVTNAPESRGAAGWLLGISLRNQGRLREAKALAEHGVVPGTSIQVPGPSDPTAVAIIHFDLGRYAEAARIFLERADADRAGTDPPGLKARNLTWHLTLAATVFAADGDTGSVRRLADSVERIGALSRFGRDGRLHHFLRGLLYQHQDRHAEAVDAFRRSLFSLTDGYTRTNLEMARSLMALRRYREAIAILQPALRGGIDGSNSYVTHTELHEALARAFEYAGRTDSAAVHYSAVAAAWRRADPQLRVRYQHARSKAIVD